MHGRPRRDMLADCRDCSGLAINDPRPRLAAALASDDYNLPLGIHAAPVGAIGLLVRWLWTLSHVGAVDFNCSRQIVAGLNGRAHRLAQLVQQDESRLRINVHGSRHLQGGRAFDAVREQGNFSQIGWLLTHL